MSPPAGGTATSSGGPTQLVLVRGNSGSGKSSIAQAVRDRYGRGLAIVEQDHLRRVLLRERDLPGGNTALLGVPGECVVDEHTSLDAAADLVTACLPRLHDHLPP